MKILWLGNIVLPNIAENENMPKVYVGGWLVNLAEMISNMDGFELIYVFDNHISINGRVEKMKYYGIECQSSYERLGSKYIDKAKEILEVEQPDIVHIWGTEQPHTLGFIEACEKVGLLNRTILSIQGLVSYYARHYTAYLPNKVVNGITIKDFLIGNIKKRQHIFEKKGLLEIEAISKVSNIIGRTDWDKGSVWNINSKAKYFHNNETLRKEFYDAIWSIKNCEKYRIFCSQVNYPIKGFHLVLEAFVKIVKEYPTAKLAVCGKNYINIPRWKQSAYEKYINDIIRKNNLSHSIEFLGQLNAEQMREQYLRCNVFVSPSSIENSPNSVGEAMLLGVPVVASRVGGVHNMLVHSIEGFLYPADEPYMLAYYVCHLFSDCRIAEKFSNNAMEHARKTHNQEENLQTLLDIYMQVIDNE